MFWCKAHSIKGKFLVAVCDESLLGKRIGKKLNINVNESFYGRDLVKEEKVLELMKRSTICNLLGKEIVKLALEKKFITKENIMFIDDIPHAQFIK